MDAIEESLNNNSALLFHNPSSRLSEQQQTEHGSAAVTDQSIAFNEDTQKFESKYNNQHQFRIPATS
jgi:hypothetical protein